MARTRSVDLLSKRDQDQFRRAFKTVRLERKLKVSNEKLAEQMQISTRSVGHYLEKSRPLRKLHAVEMLLALDLTEAEWQNVYASCPWLKERVGAAARTQNRIKTARKAMLEKHPPLCVLNGDFNGFAAFIVAQIPGKSKIQNGYIAKISMKLRKLHQYTAESFAEYSWTAAEAVVEWARTDRFFRGHFEPRGILDVEHVAIVLQALAHANEKKLPHSPKRMLAKP